MSAEAAPIAPEPDDAASVDEVARAWRAEEAAANEKAQKNAAKLDQAEAAAGAPGEEPKEEAPPAEKIGSSESAAHSAAAMAWVLVDVFAKRYFGPHAALTAEEGTQLTAATVPVLQKYFPDTEVSPELVLLGTVVTVYGAKLMGAQAAPTAAPPAEKEVNTPPPPVARGGSIIGGSF